MSYNVSNILSYLCYSAGITHKPWIMKAESVQQMQKFLNKTKTTRLKIYASFPKQLLQPIDLKLPSRRPVRLHQIVSQTANFK